MKRLRWWYWWLPVYVAGSIFVAGCGGAAHGTVIDKRISALGDPELLIQNMGARGDRAEWEGVSQSDYDDCQLGEEWTKGSGCD